MDGASRSARPRLGRLAALVVVTGASWVAASGTVVLGASLAWSPEEVEVLGTVGGLAAFTAGLVLVMGRRRLSRWMLSAAVLAWGVGFWTSTLLPLDVPPPAVRVHGQLEWRLSTGSRIALVKIASRRSPADTPIVYLHGGPGVSELPDIAPVLAPLAGTGHDVYIYDQLGAGRSGRLLDPRAYTLERALDDLDAIRRRIRAPRFILIGHSWGATLAAAYLALHPRRVAGVVFTSPGALEVGPGVAPGDPASRLTTGERLGLYTRALQPRSLLAYALTVTHPDFAHAFAGDAEMDHRFAALFAASRPGLLCNGHLASRIATDGVGHYANQLTGTARERFDPRVRLRKVRVPALVMRGACDYLPPENADAYVAAIPGARHVNLRGAGHQLYVERPARYLELLRRFFRTLP